MTSLRIVLIILSLAIFAAGQRKPVTIFLAGDSTMAAKQANKRPETGWGEMLGKHFRDGTVQVDNRAANGRSTKSFLAEGRWQSILDSLKKGDFVFIQFGHNDQAKDRSERYTPAAEFKANLERYVADVRAGGGEPVLLTPVMRRRFDREGKFFDTHGEYPDLVRAVAREQKVQLIDMHRMSESVIARYGAERSRELFLHLKPGENANYPQGIEDNTHFSPSGAEEMAKLAVGGIRAEKIGLRKFLRKDQIR